MVSREGGSAAVAHSGRLATREAQTQRRKVEAGGCGGLAAETFTAGQDSVQLERDNFCVFVVSCVTPKSNRQTFSLHLMDLLVPPTMLSKPN